MSSKTAADPSAGPPWSLAARLTAWYAGSAFALVLLTSGFLYWALAQNLDREDDQALREQVRALQAVLRGGPGEPAAVRREAAWVWAAHPSSQVYVRILDTAGETVVEAPGMAALLPPAVFAPPVETGGSPRAVSVRAADGRPFWVLAARAAAGPAGVPYIVQAALDESQEVELLAEYRRNLALALGTALVACTLGGYAIARRGVRPVRAITATARRIRPTNLGERIAAAGLPAELRALAETFNGMLDRLEESFGRLARFSADLAHELRTPVNNLRGGVEVALGRPRTPEEYREALGSALEECDRLARMIDGLLFLARAEDPRTQVRREDLDLGHELAAVREFFEATAAEEGVRLEVAAAELVPARLDRTLLQRAVGNLVANALAHTPRGGTVTLSARRDRGGAVVEVADTGVGIPAEHLPFLFDRLYRVDRARPSAAGHLGLGLAIVKGVVELHGGRVRVASAPGAGTRLTLIFPPAGRPEPALTASPVG